MIADQESNPSVRVTELALAVLALAGFLVSLSVHGLTYFDISLVARTPALWSLHLGIFVVFIPMVMVGARRVGTDRRRDPWGRLFRYHPRSVSAIAQILILYAVVNFIIGFAPTNGGSPAIRDGERVLQSHGRIVRKLSETEAQHFEAIDARMLSGHWLAFYGIPAMYFGLRRRFAVSDGASRSQPRYTGE